MNEDRRTIDTDGGAYIEGKVEVKDGDFVGRDKHEHYHLDQLDTKTPFQAPQLRDQYVERPAELKRLKDALLPAESGGPLPVSRALLHGIAAVGKSTLAAAFAHDDAVQAAFPDGVLWVTLGTEPNVPQRLADWGRALGDPSVLKGAYADEQAGTRELLSRLQDKACLLVVDDAWKAEHVEPFLVGGPGCLLLVTSRKTDVLPGATPLPLDEMREEEALALMAKWAGEISEADRATATWLAEELGYLPLALELMGVQVKNLDGWAACRQRWQEQRLAAVKRGRWAKKKADSLLLSLELSLQGLHKEDRAPYLQLGVFPDDIPFPASAAAALWGLDTSDATDFLIDLTGQALLAPRVVDGARCYTFHDVLRDFVVTQLGKEGGKEAHGVLLAGYRARCGGAWAALARDGYIHDHLAWHMSEAEWHERLFALIDKPWMDAQFERSLSHRSFAGDVDTAIAAAGEEPVKWGPLVRGCLIYATLGTMATNVPPEALGVLALTGDRRQVGRALGYAALMQHRRRQADSFRLIGEALSQMEGNDQEVRAAFAQALVAAEGIGQEKDQAESLGKVAQSLAGVGEVAQALAAAERIGDEKYKVETLSGVAGALAMGEETEAVETAVQQALAAAEGIGDGRYKALALSGAARALVAVEEAEAAAQAARQALAIVEGIGDERYKAEALSGVAGALAAVGEVEALRRALAVAVGIGDERYKVLALSAVAQALASVEEGVTLRRALAAADWIEDEVFRARALSGVAQALAAVGEVEGLQQALAAAQGIEDEWDRAEALSQVAQTLAQVEGPKAAANAAQQALAAVEKIEDSLLRALALSQVAQALAVAGEAEQALKTVEGIEDEWDKALALSEVAQALAAVGQLEGVQQALAAAERIGGGEHKGRALDGIARALAQVQEVDQALAVAEKIEGWSDRAGTLSEVAQVLAYVGEVEAAAEAAEQALAAAERIGDERYKALALGGVAQSLAGAGKAEAAGEVVRRALAAAEGMVDERDRAKALVGVAQALAVVGEVEGLERVLVMAGEIGDERDKAEALGEVARALAVVGKEESAVEAAHEALAAAERIEGERASAEALSAVSQALAVVGEEEAAAKAVQQALEVAEGIEDVGARADALREVARALAAMGEEEAATEAALQALAAAEKIGNERYKALALSGVAQVLAAVGAAESAAKAAQQALEAAEETGDETYKVWVRSWVAQALDAEEVEEVLQQALAAADGIGDERARARTLSGMAQAWAQSGQSDQALTAFLAAFRSARLGRRESVFEVLGQAAPSLAGIEDEDVLWQVCEAIREVDSWWGAN